ncbi:amine oxidase catalytic domain-containing protein [Laetiporus sulphureus 93-53]|uniref:Amine oxidase n=1 Tax=Laetiporus sulphureus 93-53 TaxID=1314785 RepID=A0A165GFX8_9APHY|nr:amine oxidase catalytic domain-containing protein [Laetiporus sulphureus 93-53]KZT10294.1 amine oxidase catalytic domain-containing protein [Laetiporus sulphureus 93-53]
MGTNATGLGKTEAAHIIPFSLNDFEETDVPMTANKTTIWTALQAFSGHLLDGPKGDDINSLGNVLTLEASMHQMFDELVLALESIEKVEVELRALPQPSVDSRKQLKKLITPKHVATTGSFKKVQEEGTGPGNLKDFLLILASQSHEYVCNYNLYQDDNIEIEVRLTGIVQVFGATLAPGVNVHYHQHFFCCCVDPMVDGLYNTVNFAGNAFITRDHPLEVQSEDARDVSHELDRRWSIINPKKCHPYPGKFAGCLIMGMKGMKVPLMMRPDGWIGKRAPFAHKPLWVVKDVEGERGSRMWPCEKYVPQTRDTCAETIVKGMEEDILLYLTTGVIHIPRQECDLPVHRKPYRAPPECTHSSFPARTSLGGAFVARWLWAKEVTPAETGRGGFEEETNVNDPSSGRKAVSTPESGTSMLYGHGGRSALGPIILVVEEEEEEIEEMENTGGLFYDRFRIRRERRGKDEDLDELQSRSPP